VEGKPFESGVDGTDAFAECVVEPGGGEQGVDGGVVVA